MPFESDAQRRFMYAKHPGIAKRWQEHTPKDKDLPEKVSDKSKEKTVETAEKEAAVLGYRLGFLKRAYTPTDVALGALLFGSFGGLGAGEGLLSARPGRESAGAAKGLAGGLAGGSTGLFGGSVLGATLALLFRQPELAGRMANLGGLGLGVSGALIGGKLAPKLKMAQFCRLNKRADLVPGGKADNEPDSEFPDKALQQGAKVEAEHTGNSQLAREIAKDHLSESNDYYTRLKKMESQMKQDKAAVYSLGRSLFAGQKQAVAECSGNKLRLGKPIGKKLEENTKKALEEKRAYGKLMSLLYRAARSGVKGTGDVASKVVGKVSPKAQKVLNAPIAGSGTALGGAGQAAASAARLTDKAEIDRMANETIRKMMAG